VKNFKLKASTVRRGSSLECSELLTTCDGSEKGRENSHNHTRKVRLLVTNRVEDGAKPKERMYLCESDRGNLIDRRRTVENEKLVQPIDWGWSESGDEEKEDGVESEESEESEETEESEESVSEGESGSDASSVNGNESEADVEVGRTPLVLGVDETDADAQNSSNEITMRDGGWWFDEDEESDEEGKKISRARMSEFRKSFHLMSLQLSNQQLVTGEEKRLSIIEKKKRVCF
jgi:hypothetical protein